MYATVIDHLPNLYGACADRLFSQISGTLTEFDNLCYIEYLITSDLICR